MTSLLRWVKATFQRVPSPPLCFPASGFETVSGSELEEEQFEVFKKGQYYAINIGDVLSSRYQIIDKLGFEIWDLFEGKHMFHGNDSDWKEYITHAHLTEVIDILGLSLLDMLKCGKWSLEFFTEDDYLADVKDSLKTFTE
ncbi:hypothetical protein I7I51_04626 [Histoplasma capsulatum]|uniref:Uncharacterized protein n=1 Tax=Ajellomyces capsulatus TaxID=5037 RepID=A0A8A1M3B0_AJECA|nr:hypothetical protein I7I51_04626 [Histoplasma capsulatum]